MTLTRKIGLLLLLPLAGSLASVGLFASHLSETRNDSHFINVAGRQRMLSVELGAWARMVAIGQEDDRAGLRDRVAEFDNTLTILLHGGEILDGPLEPAPPEVRGDLEAVLDLWRGLKPDLDIVAATPRTDPRFEAAFGRAETRVAALNDASDRVVSTFAARVNRLRRQMLAVLAAIAGATGVVFIVGLWLTRRFIVRPIRHLDVAARRISGGDFSQRLEVSTRDELATLVGTFNDMTGHVERLLEAQELLRKHAEKIISSVPAGLLIADSELRVLAVNRSFAERSRCEQAALVGRPVIDVLGIPELEPHLRHVLHTQETRSGLLRTMQYPGTSATRPVKIAVTGTRPAEEEEGELLVVVEDLSEEERLATLARASERRFQEVIENATDGIVLMGKDGLISSFNRSAEKMFGWGREEVLGKSVKLLMPEKYRALHDHGVARYLGTGQSTMLGTVRVLEGLRKDESIFPIEGTISAYRVDGEIVFTGVLRDITERRAAGEALRRSEASFRALIERSPDSVAVHRHGCFVYVNPAVLAFLGYDRADELVGRPVLDIVHSEDREVVATRLRDMVDTGEPSPAREERFLRRDGGVVTAEVVALPLVFDGEPAIVVIARDVTERKQLAAKMMQMDRMIAVGTLAAGVAHEINNPLSYVVANLDLVAREFPGVAAAVRRLQAALIRRSGSSPPTPAALDPTDLPRRLEELQQALEEAREGAERVRDIVRDLKTFSRAEEDQREPVELPRVLDSAVNMASNEIRHRARLVKDYGPVPHVEASESRLGQVFLNLLVNAAQAIPEGRADHNEIRVVTRTDEAGRAVVEVRDTGSGIPPEAVGRIFDPFFTTKPVGQGTGLGLSICQSIVQALGGELTVESAVGKGTAFKVVLPAARLDDTEPRPLQATSDTPAPGRRGSILIVDDEPMVGAALRRILARDHEVVAVTRGREAIDRLERGERYDLILCDLMMPDMTGMDLHAELSLRFSDCAARMIFMTGGAFTPQARDFLDTVPNQHIEKPFSVQNVRALVRALLR